jgi:hypothetical protein
VVVGVSGVVAGLVGWVAASLVAAAASLVASVTALAAASALAEASAAAESAASLVASAVFCEQAEIEKAAPAMAAARIILRMLSVSLNNDLKARRDAPVSARETRLVANPAR